MSHAHDHGFVRRNDGAERRLVIAFVITVTVMVLEAAAAAVFNSLALAADAAHMLADAGALGIALVAARIAARPASTSHTYGYKRAEVIAAQVNALLLVIMSGLILLEAASRFGSPGDVNGAGLFAVAIVGLVANLSSALLLHRHGAGNLNVRAAALHTLGDAAGSVAAIIAGLVIASGGSSRADSVASAVVGVFVIVAALRLLRETTRVLLEASPVDFDTAALVDTLERDDAVLAVHDLHVWSIAPGALALSAHIEIAGEVTLHQAQAHSVRLKALLAQDFGVGHSTLELECHPCADPSA